VLVAITAAAYLSERHAVVMDWTTARRHTLDEASQVLLSRMPGPIRVAAYVGDDPRLREAVGQLLQRYRPHASDLQLEFVDPDRDPRRTADAGIGSVPTLLVSYEGRSEQVIRLSEDTLSGALRRLARLEPRWVAYLQGEGQRDLRGDARSDLGRFGATLEEMGFSLRPLRLAEGGGIPEGIELLIVLEPERDPIAGSLVPLADYLRGGGNLLWLSDARHHPALSELEALLGVRREQGLLVDPGSKLFGRSTPEFILVSAYADHGVSKGLTSMSAFPTAASLAWESTAGWSPRGIATSPLSSWLETGDLTEAVRFDDGADTPGPLDLAVALERPGKAGGSQRALVFGDADFLSNAYLGLVGNRDLGRAAMRWLTAASGSPAPTSRAAPDLDFAPAAVDRAAIALTGPVLAPALIVLLGLVSWLRRRRR
jgi:hypothetical protein